MSGFENAAGKEGHFRPGPLVFNVGAATLIDMEGCTANMDFIPLTTHLMIHERCVFILHGLMCHEGVAERKDGANTFERKRAVVGNVFRTGTFPPLVTATTWVLSSKPPTWRMYGYPIIDRTSPKPRGPHKYLP